MTVSNSQVLFTRYQLERIKKHSFYCEPLHYMAVVVVPGLDGGTGLLNFKPTPETPSLQYFESISAGSPAEMAGLQPGDYLLEVACFRICLL